MIWKNKVVMVTPFLTIIAFFILGHFGYYHPGWMVFLLIPIMPYLVGKKKIRYSISVIITIFYLIANIITKGEYWDIGLVVFLLIPVFHILLSPGKKYFKDDDF